MRLAAKLTVLLIGFVVILACLRGWDSGTNRGLPWGYYGEFNRIGNGLLTIPEVRINGHWENRDITLEEFGFELVVDQSTVLQLSFSETDPIRDLRGNALTQELRSRIQQLVAANQPPP